MYRERGYCLPPGYDSGAMYDGFFVKAEAVFASNNPTRDWDAFVCILTDEFSHAFPDFKVIRQWQKTDNGQSRYTLLYNKTVALDADDTNDDFLSLYLLAEKLTPTMSVYLSVLQSILCKYYPKSVYKRISYRKLEKVSGDENGR